MQDWYTADLHLGHGKVAEHRGFDNVGEHDELILHNLNDICQPGRRIWILGDVTSGKDEDKAWEKLAQISQNKWCSFHLISGNHDSSHPMHRNSHRNRLATPFETIDSMGTFRHNRAKVMLSHFPYAGDRGEDRYPEYRLRDTGAPIIHGHTHSTEKVSRSSQGTLQICVSLDAWGMKPARKEDLTKIINEEN